MLSKFLSAAKTAFLSPQEEQQQPSFPESQPAEATTTVYTITKKDDEVMVTTRRQSGIVPDDESVTNSPAVNAGSAAAASKKRRRNEPTIAEVEEVQVSTPVAATSKRQKKLPLRGKLEDDNDTPKGTPNGRLTRSMRAAGVSSPKDSPKGGRKAADAEEQQEEEVTDDQVSEDDESGSEADVFVTPAQHLRASPQKRAAPSSATPIPKHKRFGSEEPIVLFPEDTKEQPAEEEDEDQSSDDDAPEVVTTSSAAQKIKDAARDAAKARKLEEETERQKRRERDARLKEQVQSSNKRQRPETAVDEESTTEMGDAEPATKKLDANNLPEFLPMEYLQDRVDKADESPRAQLVQKISKKTKFTDDADLTPRDKKVGNTTFTVAQHEKTQFLAPKAAKLARSLKEDWINARGMGGLNGGKPRAPASKGFFVKR